LNAPDQAVQDIIEAVWAGDPAVVVPSPPGSGKSSTVERVVYAIGKLAHRKVAVACNTNAQVVDLVTRTAKAYPDLSIGWIARQGVDNTIFSDSLPNVNVVNNQKKLDEETMVVFSTTAKWQYVNTEENTFFADLLIVDEAWQCPDVMFAQISCLAPRYLLVGDPGQIAPVTTVDVTRWRHKSDGPQRPAPMALLERQRKRVYKGEDFPVTEIALPATRRFGQDTTNFIQPAFYPDLPFVSIRQPRHLTYKKTDTTSPLDQLLVSFGPDKEIVVGELPFKTGTANASEIAEIAAELVTRAIEHVVVVDDKGNEKPLEAKDVGVVCAHIADVTNVQGYLSSKHPEVWVDTAERWQGAERELMIVWDPMAGKTDLTDFSRDSGRMCVMMSRHRSGCVLLTRDGVTNLLRFAASGTDRILSDKIEDPSYLSWKAQTSLRSAFADRVIQLADSETS
jgi:hypothetical protein